MEDTNIVQETKRLLSIGVLKTLLDKEPIGVAVYKSIKNDTDFLHVYTNQAYEALQPSKQTLGKIMTKVWPELTGKIEEFIKPVIERGETTHLKDVEVTMGYTAMKVPRKGFLNFILTPILLDSGETRVCGVVTDTTAEVRARENLATSEHRYRVAMDNSPVIASAVNKDLEYEWILNPHPAFDPALVIGKRDDELAPAEWVAELVKFKEWVFKTGKGDRRIIPIIVQGETRYYDVTAKPVFVDGEIKSIITATIEVTDQKRTEETLKQQTERLTTLLDISKIVVSALNITEVSENIISSFVDKFGLSYGTLFIYEPEQNELIPTASYGFPSGYWESIPPFKADSEYFTAQVFRASKPIIIEDIAQAKVPDVTKDALHKVEASAGKPLKAFIALPLMAYQKTVGVIFLMWPAPRQISDQDIDLFSSVAHEIAIGLENARLFEAQKAATKALREKDAAIRRAYTDVISAVTGGKLVLLTAEEIQLALGKPVINLIIVSKLEEMATARQNVRDTLMKEFGIKDLSRFIDPFGEALTNAVKHAGGGSYQVYRRDNIVQIRVSDEGPGIDFSRLPKATLEVGYSTTGTLGKGFGIMLSAADRVLLSTQPGNTTIVLETSL